MLKSVKIATLSLLVALAAGLVYAAEKPASPAVQANKEDKPVATVNGVTIPQARVDMRVKAAIAQGQPDGPELRQAVRDESINLEIMSQEAVKKGLDKQQDTMRQIELAKQSILVNAFVQDYLKDHPISDDTLKQEYETLKQATGAKEYKVRHILVKEENEAKSILAQLKKGAKFDKLASKYSMDPGSRDQGGALGGNSEWSLAANFVPPFAEAMGNLKKGGTSQPVQSDFGWHIIKVDDVRDFKFPPLQEVKQNLTQRLQQQSVQKMLADLRATAKVE